MTRPSLTPHQDSVRRLHARAPAPKDAYAGYVIRACQGAELEMAKLMDEQRDAHLALSFACGVAASMMDSAASSAAGNAPREQFEALRAALLLQLMDKIARALSGQGAKALVDHEPTGAVPGGNA